MVSTLNFKYQTLHSCTQHNTNTELSARTHPNTHQTHNIHKQHTRQHIAFSVTYWLKLFFDNDFFIIVIISIAPCLCFVNVSELFLRRLMRFSKSLETNLFKLYFSTTHLACRPTIYASPQCWLRINNNG